MGLTEKETLAKMCYYYRTNYDFKPPVYLTSVRRDGFRLQLVHEYNLKRAMEFSVEFRETAFKTLRLYYNHEVKRLKYRKKAIKEHASTVDSFKDKTVVYIRRNFSNRVLEESQPFVFEDEYSAHTAIALVYKETAWNPRWLRKDMFKVLDDA